MKRYFINKDQTQNPGYHHEIHKDGECRVGDQVPSSRRIDLGYHNTDADALAAGKRYFSDADGCIHCCPSIHRG